MNRTLKTLYLAAATAALTLAAVPASAQTVVPLATWGGTNHVNIRDFVPRLESAIKDLQPNDIKLEHYPNGQLGADKDMPMSIPMGQVKFAWITVNGWTGTVTDTKVMDAPTGLTMEQMSALIQKPGGIFDILNERFGEKNSVLLGLSDLGPPALVSREPILSPSDLKGKVVRVFSEGQNQAVRLMGGSPVNMGFAEVYSAMQRGMIDAAVMGYQGVDSQKMHEVAKNVLLPSSFLGTAMMGWAANKQWVDSLPQQDRDALTKAVKKAAIDNQQDVLNDIDALTKLYKERGLTITFLNPDMKEYAQWQEATAPLLAKALEELTPEMRAQVAPQGN